MLGEAAAASRVCTRQAALKERPKSCSDSEVMSESYACTAELQSSSNSELRGAHRRAGGASAAEPAASAEL